MHFSAGGDRVGPLPLAQHQTQDLLLEVGRGQPARIVELPQPRSVFLAIDVQAHVVGGKGGWGQPQAVEEEEEELGGRLGGGGVKWVQVVKVG